LISVLMIVIFVKLATGNTPGNQGFTADVFKLPGGTSSSALGLAIVLAFLSWGGFEGAAALGEETNEPRREIPRAIRNAVIGAGARAAALAPVIVIAAAGLIGMRAYGISDAVLAFFYRGTMGVLSMIVA